MTADEQATTAERELLAELNVDLPPGVDWKQGAIEYLHNLIRSEGAHNELFHLIKPFQGGPDFAPFFSEMYGFLNMVERAHLPMKAHVLDVACGPGWTAHLLAKLGHCVFGVDISPDLLEIAQRRVAGEAFGVFEGVPLQARFALHDIEAAPLRRDGPFAPYDAAFLESALHHFVNPVQALRNVAASLKEGGILCIWEGAAPQRNSEPWRQNVELMRKYRTLERPYTRRQMVKVLELAGFAHCEFFAQVNGLFDLADAGDCSRLDAQIHSAAHWNIVIAARTPDYFIDNDRRSGSASDTDAAGPGLAPGAHGAGGEWGGRELLRANLRYLKRRLDRISAAWRGRRPEQLEEDVRRMYVTLLGRAPDASGLAHYVAELRQGRSPADVRRSLMASEEYRRRTRTPNA